MRLNNKGRLALENALVLIFILIITGIILGYYYQFQEVIKKRLAQEQVYNINTAIVIYVLKKGRFPEDLSVLTKEEFLTENNQTIFKKKFLDYAPVDSEGYPLDPWGRRIGYSKENHIAYLEDR